MVQIPVAAVADDSGLTRKESMVIHNSATIYDLPPDMGAVDLSGFDSEDGEDVDL